MHSLAVLTALLGAATAAPATLSALHKRDPVSCNAGTKSVGVKHMTINKETTVNGTAKAPEKSYTKSPKSLKAAADGLSIDLQLVNNIGGDNLNAYISAADPDGKIFFMKQDGSQIFPAAGGAEPTPISDPIAIPMPAQGETFDITIPTGFSSGRIYFVQGELTFATVATDTGAVGLVQPDPSNPADPSCDLNWAFVEMTLDPNAGEIWANLSFVDMIGMIMSMTLNLNDGTKTDIVGVKREGVQAVCDGLTTQAGADGKPWGDLCMNGADGTLRRILAPTHFQGGMDDYFDQYVNDMWAKYANEDLTVDLGNGETSVCRTNGDAIECDGSNKNYQKPTAADIWGCNSGPFVVDAAVDTFQHQRIVPILCAAIHRATLGLDDGNTQPGPGVDEYYSTDVNNHYGRITHENQPDGRGYAFPYDDVSAAGGDGETAGLIHSTDYKNLVFYLGGMDQ